MTSVNWQYHAQAIANTRDGCTTLDNRQALKSCCLRKLLLFGLEHSRRRRIPIVYGN